MNIEEKSALKVPFCLTWSLDQKWQFGKERAFNQKQPFWLCPKINNYSSRPKSNILIKKKLVLPKLCFYQNCYS